MKNISINIWDDFYEDDEIPNGEKQETYIYVEDDLPINKKRLVLEYLMNFIIENMDVSGLKIWMEYFESKKKYPHLVGTHSEIFFFDRWEIKIENLTHERLDKWIDKFDETKIFFKSVPLIIQSES